MSSTSLSGDVECYTTVCRTRTGELLALGLVLMDCRRGRRRVLRAQSLKLVRPAQKRSQTFFRLPLSAIESCPDVGLPCSLLQSGTCPCSWSCALRMSFATPSPPPPPRQLATPPPRPSRDLCSESTHSLAACATDLDSASSHSIRSSSGLASGKHASVLVVARFRPVSERELKLDSGRSTQPAPLTLDAHSVRAHQSTPVP